MIYKNPIIKGFYPDPSVCCANGRYYLVTSSFQYFPGVPLFESDDLVNWKQIGHVLTRKSQLPLEYAHSSGGIFAPTIRYNDGTFFMVTTNTTTGKNFYVTTNDIYGQWSEPIFVEQDGIDPSLYFEDGHAYFMSNGTDDDGNGGITQCEIDIKTGIKLSESKTIWKGSGGRYLESPHLYKIGGYYYITAAEGGTEYGHMITCARSRNIWGEYEGYSQNPVLTNRNLGGYAIQGVGHGDLIQKQNTGEWFIVHLGFRQIDMWQPFHHLGRETFLTPVKFNSDGWFTAGQNGTTVEEFEIQGDFIQTGKKSYSFADTDEWIYLRNPDFSKYETSGEKFVLYGTENTLDTHTPTFTGIRHRDFESTVSCDVHLSGANSEAGLTVYMDENHHYDLAIMENSGKYQAVLRLNIGDAKYIRNSIELKSSRAVLEIASDNFVYCFKVRDGENVYDFGSAQTRYVSTEVACGFTGVIYGLYAAGKDCKAEFTDFSNNYV
ncbi:MAG: family 43 glycosylhydrolase [Ruminococcus sp.]|nr:family 43 glycosylhydrolase [Ruminococcus sp.]